MGVRLAILVLLLALMTGATSGANTRNNLPARIGVRVNNDAAEFYNRATGERFVPRGVNYFYIVPVSGVYEDRVFGVGVYDATGVRADFHALAGHGYNIVRMFLDSCGSGTGCAGNPSGAGLNPPYLDNIAEAMRIAADEGIYLLLTSNDLPDQGGYWDLSNRGSNQNFAGYRNAHYLTTYGVLAATQYWRDLLEGLSERGAPFEVVLGWSLLNEQWFFNDQPPLSLNTGILTTANGQAYDLADPRQKRQMLTDGIVYYMTELRNLIREYDPDALVTMGFFHPDFPNRARAGDFRYVDTAPLLQAAPLDFFDFHAYPGVELTLRQYAENFGMIGYDAKPVLMGEAGAFTFAYASPEAAARALLTWFAESCAVGYDGWLYWGFYRAPEAIGDATWGFADDDGYLLTALAPINQPDPCAPAPLPTDNLALGKPVTASMSLPDEPPEQAVDGSASGWGAGSHPPQWIQIDLQQPSTIGRIRLQVQQYPDGSTQHRVWAIREDGTWVLLYEFAGNTRDSQWLEYALSAPLQHVRAIRVETLESPSWAAWKEIEVIAGQEADSDACIVLAGAAVNLRAEPDVSAALAGTLSPGQAAYSDGQAAGADGLRWWHLPYGAWVREDVISTGESCGHFTSAP